jgi:SAM-dependent methyltransferase
MTALAHTGPNAEQIKYWNEIYGPRWVAQQELLDAQIAPLGRLAMDRVGIRTGERVLDVGCGCGDTTIEIAGRVGPSGAVTGVDITTVMLERARTRAREANLTHVHFENADAQTYHFAPDSFDVVFSRFGVMFFADPVAAFANLRAALRPGGRVAFACWQTLPQNSWLFVPLMAAAQHIPLPQPPAPGAPGPFSFADPERVRGILSQAGFADIALEAVLDTLLLGAGGDLDRALDLVLQTGPVAAALREAGTQKLPLVVQAIRDALTPFVTPDGVRMACAAWIVTARR